MSETAVHLKIPCDAENVEPLIVFDSCEILAAHEHNRLTHDSGKPYTLLEAVSVCVPRSHSIFFIGCNAKINSQAALATSANVRNNGPLLPLSMNAHIEAIRFSWKNSVDNNLVASIDHLSGGLPGLLRLAHQTKDAEMSFACGSLNAHSNCFGEF